MCIGKNIYFFAVGIAAGVSFVVFTPVVNLWPTEMVLKGVKIYSENKTRYVPNGAACFNGKLYIEISCAKQGEITLLSEDSNYISVAAKKQKEAG